MPVARTPEQGTPVTRTPVTRTQEQNARQAASTMPRNEDPGTKRLISSKHNTQERGSRNKTPVKQQV